ncbi:MAG: pilus assembly protein [Planctomycetes bacterium]|nr:pilus assembly protein [Planctomycetota bacterium]
MAVVAPLLVLIFMGMVEVSRGIMVQQILTNAAREGAREAILEGATTSDVQSTVTQYLANSTLSGATVSVTPDPTVAAPRQPVTVVVNIPYANVMWLSAGYIGSGVELSASCTMRCEAQ